MKTLIALTIALLILVPQSASALTITHGYVFLPNDSHREAFFGGDSFFVVALEEWEGPVLSAFGVDPFTRTMVFAPSPSTRIDVGSETCVPIEFTVACGGIALTSPGFAMPADWPPTTLFAANVPFSATGLLLVGRQSVRYNG